MSFQKNSTLWSEDAADCSKAARATVARARHQAQSLTKKFPGIVLDLHRFSEDLDAVEAFLSDDSTAFRKVRSLTSVHLPAILTSLETLLHLKENGADPQRLSMIENDIKKSFLAARQARNILEAGAITALEIEAETLRSAVMSDAEASDAPKNTKSEDNTNTCSVGLCGRLGQLATRHAKSLTDPLLSQVSAGQKSITALSTDVADRLDAGASLARGYVAGLIEDGYDRVASPVSRRASAIGSVLATASISAIAGGMITAIIFPPAVPIALGVSLINGAGEYERSMKASKQKIASLRAKRQQDRAVTKSGHLARLKGKSPIVRMETGYIYMAVNCETGDCQGIVLAGRYAGENLENIPAEDLDHLTQTAPDQETKDILLAFRNYISKGTNQTGSDKPDTPEENTNLILLGLEALSLSFLE